MKKWYGMLREKREKEKVYLQKGSKEYEELLEAFAEDAENKQDINIKGR